MTAAANERIVVSLDVESEQRALDLVEQLGDAATFYKVGLQLLTAAGPGVVRHLVARGKRVFLDLKLFEIPNSVASAVRAAGELGASAVTVHAMGGSRILRAAVDAARPYPGLEVLALTVVTSLRDDDLLEVGISANTEQQVLRLAQLARAAGCHGVVASALEAAAIRAEFGSEMLIYTPGTQLPGEGTTDQARVSTPQEAIRAGSTHLLVGRAIVGSASPLAEFERLRRCLDQA